jgi:hypothetical protein
MSLAQLARTRGVAVMLPASLQKALDMLADIVTDKRLRSGNAALSMI